MKVQRSLVWGGITFVVLIVACVLGPFVLPDTGDGDPLHASLLAPLSRVTVLELIDGRTLMSPDVTLEGGAYLLRGPRRVLSIPEDEVTARRLVAVAAACSCDQSGGQYEGGGMADAHHRSCRSWTTGWRVRAALR